MGKVSGLSSCPYHCRFWGHAGVAHYTEQAHGCRRGLTFVPVMHASSHVMCVCHTAQKMDPQLRKLLEVSYEALLHAGLVIGELPPERCGVYIGCCGSEVRCADWSRLLDVHVAAVYRSVLVTQTNAKTRPYVQWVAVFPEPSTNVLRVL